MAVMNRILVFDTKSYDRESLEPMAQTLEVPLKFYEHRLTPETADLVSSAAGVCVFVNDVLNRPVLEQIAAAGVRAIFLRCAGFNNVDIEAAYELGMRVARVPAYSPYAVAEHAIALLMALNRKVTRASNRVHDHNFSLQGLVGFDIHGKTIGVVGTGRIGKVAAEIFAGFGTKVLVYDRYPDQDWATNHGFTYVDLRRILRESDVVSLHTPLVPETFHLIDKDALALMKPTAILINVSRGALVDAKALLKALKKNRIGGVALDVYEEEEGVFFEDHSAHVISDDTLVLLLSHPNVIITSHQAFLTNEALDEIARVSVGNMYRFLHDKDFLIGTEVKPAE